MVLGPGLNGRRAGKEKVGQGVAGGADPELVQRAAVPEGLDNIEGLSSFRFAVVQPGEARNHILPIR